MTDAEKLDAIDVTIDIVLHDMTLSVREREPYKDYDVIRATAARNMARTALEWLFEERRVRHELIKLDNKEGTNVG